MKNFRAIALSSLVATLAACASPAEDPVVQTEGAISDEVTNPDAEKPAAEPTAKPTSTGEFTISLSTATPVVNLGESVTIDVTVTPNEENHFDGEIDLGVTGLSTGVSATTVKTSVKQGASKAQIVISAALTSYVTPKTSSVPITVTATSGEARATAPASFKVAPVLTLYIPSNIRELYSAPGGPLRAEWGEPFGPAQQPLRTQADNPITVRIFNKDSVQHILHGPGGTFPHGEFNAPIQPNAFEMKNGEIRPRSVKIGQTVQGYIHGEPNSTNAAFKITVAATE